MRVKAGDLAYITKAMKPENIGVVVKVLSPIGDMNDGHGFRWWIRSHSPIETVFAHTGQDAGPAILMGCPDAWLTPIAGPSIGDLIDEDLVITNDTPAEVE